MIEAYSDRSVNIATAYTRLARIGQGDTAAAQMLANRPFGMRRVTKGVDLGSTSAGVMLSGWACHHRQVGESERHIFGVLLPGDIVGTSEDGAASLTRITALSPTEIADIALVDEDRVSTASLSSTSAAERRLTEARYLDQMVRLGGLSALRATGHLVLELHDRLFSVGLARRGRFHMPIGQRVIASILGLSAVHVNRTLQQLSRDGLVASGAGWMGIIDRAALLDLVACPLSFDHVAGRAGLTRDFSGDVPADVRKVS